MSSQVNRPEFWEEKYESGGDRWERGAPAPPLAAHFAEREPAEGARALVPGCGRGHEAMMLAERGWRTVGVDIARPAIEAARELAAARDLPVEFQRADFFAVAADPGWRGSFDLVVEHTCYCAIDPVRRDEYADAVVALLRPGGRFVALFWSCGIVDGPPWTTEPDELNARFGPRLLIESFARAEDSFPERAGAEWLMVARRPAA